MNYKHVIKYNTRNKTRSVPINCTSFAGVSCHPTRRRKSHLCYSRSARKIVDQKIKKSCRMIGETIMNCFYLIVNDILNLIRDCSRRKNYGSAGRYPRFIFTLVGLFLPEITRKLAIEQQLERYRFYLEANVAKCILKRIVVVSSTSSFLRVESTNYWFAKRQPPASLLATSQCRTIFPVAHFSLYYIVLKILGT